MNRDHIASADRSREESPRSFAGLDILRFLCALSVLCWHYSRHFLIPLDVNTQHAPFYTLLAPLFENGDFAVQIFWAISGFIFFWKYADTLNQRKISGKEFAILRLSRLYPLHLATLLAVAVLQLLYAHEHNGAFFIYHPNDLGHFVLQLLFISYQVQGQTHSFNGPIWSISIELLAYAVFFFVASSTKLRRLNNTTLIAVFFVLAWNWRQPSYAQFAECVMLFFLGGLAYVVITSISNSPQSAARTQAARCLRMFAVFNVLAAVVNFCSGRILSGYFLGDYAHLYAYLIFVPSLLILFAKIPVPQNRWARISESLGNLTYSSYLIHFPLQLLAVIGLDAAGVSRNIFENPWAFLAFFGLTFLLSHMIYVGFERPAQAYLRTRLLHQNV